LDRGHTSALEVRPAGAGDDSVIKFDSNADESYKSVAEYGASPSIETGRDLPEAAFALAKLAQAMLCGHEKDTSSRGGSAGSASRLAKVRELCARALLAIDTKRPSLWNTDTETRDDQARYHTDHESDVFLCALGVACRACLAVDSEASVTAALAHATKALTYCELRFGGWDLRVFEWLRKTATCLMRQGVTGRGFDTETFGEEEGPELGTGTSYRDTTAPSTKVPTTSRAAVSVASAIDHLKRALEIRKRVSGAKHGDTLRVMNELATAHKRVGDFPRATRLDLERRRLGKAVDELTCTDAAQGGHLEVLQWARANGCPMGQVGVCVCGEGRAPRDAAVGARERLPVERTDVRERGRGRAPRCVAVGARERLPVGHDFVHEGGGRWAPRCAAVGAVERRTVGRGYVRVCGEMRET
jgi:hypothetical protein